MIPSGEAGTRDDTEVEYTIQIGVRHAHQWEAVHNLSPKQFDVSEPFPGQSQVVALTGGLPGGDTDHCTKANCPFPGGNAANVIHTTVWSAPVGTFGRMSGTTFIPTNDPAEITHWQAPSSIAGRTLDVPITRTSDDTPSAVEPDNTTVATFNDNVASWSKTIRIVAHQHQWTPTSPIDVAPLTVIDARPEKGTIIALTYHGAADVDHCSVSGCSFSSGDAENGTVRVSYSQGGAAGQFGYMDGGTFVQSSDPEAITHWKAPDSTGGAMGMAPYLDVTLSVMVEDVPSAFDTDRESEVATYDDPIASGAIVVRVLRHKHQWQPLDNLSPGYLFAQNEQPYRGQVISLSRGMSYDWDPCEKPQCTFPMGMAPNTTYVTGWESTANGQQAGVFGWLDGQGQFVPWTPGIDPNLVTHWKAPTTGLPAGGLPVTLKMWVDDTPPAPPTAVDPGLNEAVNTYDDSAAFATKVVTVQGHTHAWQATHNLPTPSLTVETDTPNYDQVIEIAEVISNDSDSCTNLFQCPFPSNTAANLVVPTEWSDGGAGGQFGYLSDNTFTASSDPALVTHYKCSATGGDATLTVTVDDLWEDIEEPGLGTTTDTFDDDAKSAQKLIHVTPPHVHHWTNNGNLASTRVRLQLNNTDVTNACTYQVLDLKHDPLTPDSDVCDAPGCPFPGGVATEILAQHQKRRYVDLSGGGKFGRYDEETGWTELAPTAVTEITHYLTGCNPATAEVVLVLDDAATALDPVTEEEVATYDDGEKNSLSATLAVTDCPASIQTKRRVEDNCTCKECNKVSALSTISPLSGAVGFDVPVTGWTYRGSSLGFSLDYNSQARADPQIHGMNQQGVRANPDFSHMSGFNSRWNHNWGQFIEVVEGESGETHALWHTGGGTVSFNSQPDGTWRAEDSYHSLVSGGFSTTTVKTRENLTMMNGAAFKSKEGRGKKKEAGGAKSNSTPGFLTLNQKIRFPPLQLPWGWFEAKDGDGTVYRFETVFWEQGDNVAIPYLLLNQVTDRWGRVVNLNWDNGKLMSVIDGASHGLTFDYAGGLLAAVHDTHGRTHSFVYAEVNGFPQLTGVHIQGPGSPNRVDTLWAFDYGTAADAAYYGGNYTGDLVIRKTEPDGKLVHYYYESTNPAKTAFSDWSGRVTHEHYDDPTEGNRRKEFVRNGTTITSPGGGSITYGYSGSDLVSVVNNETGRSVSYAYDQWHNLTSVRTNTEPEGTPALATIAYTYAADGRTIVKATTTDVQGHVSETEFGNFNLPTQTTVFGTTSGYNQVSQWLYNGVGNLLASTEAVGTPLEQTSTLTYGSANAPDSPTGSSDPLNRVSTIAYDALGRVVGSASPENLVAPPGHPDRDPTGTALSYTADGLPSLITDTLGRQIEHRSDRKGSIPCD